MSPKDDAENWRTVVRFGKWLKANPLLIGVMAYALGGGSGTLLEKLAPEKPSPQLDTLMMLARQIPEVKDSLKAHGEFIREVRKDVAEIDDRLVMVEPDNSRAPYRPRRPRGEGRHRE